MIEPRAFPSDGDFPHRSELEEELRNGAVWRRDDRGHKAADLAGLYQIRLNISLDQNQNGIADAENEMAANLRFLVGNLKDDPDREVRAYFLSGSKRLLFWLFEDEASGTYLGSIVGYRTV